MKNKILITLAIFIFVSILYIFKVPNALSRFTSLLSGDVEGSIAFYVIDSDYQVTEINLDEIVPSNTPYEYAFTVSNYDSEKRLETNAEYHIVIRATTNLNLEYELYENNSNTSALISKEVVVDEDGTYYYVMKTDTEYFGFVKNQKNYYTLSIKFPLEYINFEYQDIIESLEIIILSSQIVD